MLLIKVILLAFFLIAAAFVFLAMRIILKKNGSFPETSIGHNREMKKRGITCVHQDERMIQEKSETSCIHCSCKEISE